ERWTVLTLMPKFQRDPAVLELGKPSAYFARLAAIAGLPASAFDDAPLVVAFADLREISVIASDLGDRASRSNLPPHMDEVIEALGRLSIHVNLPCREGCESAAPAPSLAGTGAAPMGGDLLPPRRVAR